ncbi:MAG: ABC transporter ATP-binding protein [Chloroflexi bacterium]|nr:ABC transporter ATP-binding protein [Chloroflexota bacterium]
MTDPQTDAGTPALDCVALRKTYDNIRAVDEVSLQVAAGELLAILGPSGCGKTTLLRLIAGFETPDAGRITIAGHPVVSPRRLVPPERRHVGMVFQDYALFPHMTVAANVAYGIDAPRVRRNPFARPAPVQQRVDDVLDLVELTHVADRHPHELSGGEAQRVALARALAPRPDLILLDEPFSNLDAQLRVSVRTEVRDIIHRADASAVFVTHDQEEAFSFADRVAIMRAGRIDQVGSATDIYRDPANRFVASFVGDADFLPGTPEPGGVRTEIGLVTSGQDWSQTSAVDVLVRPESVRLKPSDDNDAAQVIEREFYGHDQVLLVRLPSGNTLRVRLGPAERYGPGDRVTASIAGHATIFPSAGASPDP